ncbi:MAG: GTPase domain-containing protein [Gemmataceae bacterium]
MDTLSTRALISQVADDLGYLEQHATQTGDGPAAARIRLAAALARNVIGPTLDGQEPLPLHVVVVGGAGAGKSTVANILSGSVASEANPQAGFTRHPIAFTAIPGPLVWANHLGFLGPLVRLPQPASSSLDQDVYQVRRVGVEPDTFTLLKEWIVWDCPDMTTWAAQAYTSRLIEAAALADVIVYVASDERYNDEIPTQFLSLLLRSGKPVICVLVKMREEIAEQLLAHFRTAVLEALPDGLGRGVVSVHAIPFLTPEQRADPVRAAAKYRIPLLNQVAVLGQPPQTARRRTILGASLYLKNQSKALLDVARADVQALETWHHLVRCGHEEFNARYIREYLASEKYRGFDEALVRLMTLLELPGIGQVISGTLYLVRTPFRLLGNWISQSMNRPETPHRPEEPILRDALAAWSAELRKEVLRRGKEHPLWGHLSQGYSDQGLEAQLEQRFAAAYRDYQANLTLEVERTARNIYERLQQNPVALNSLRATKFALDAAAIGGTLMAGGLNVWDLVLVPLVATLTHKLVEFLGQQVVDSEREATRQRQASILRQHLSQPLAEWLAAWPTTGGSPFERLQRALTRIPGTIEELHRRVQADRSLEQPPKQGV